MPEQKIRTGQTRRWWLTRGIAAGIAAADYSTVPRLKQEADVGTFIRRYEPILIPGTDTKFIFWGYTHTYNTLLANKDVFTRMCHSPSILVNENLGLWEQNPDLRGYVGVVNSIVKKIRDARIPPAKQIDFIVSEMDKDSGVKMVDLIDAIEGPRSMRLIRLWIVESVMYILAKRLVTVVDPLDNNRGNVAYEEMQNGRKVGELKGEFLLDLTKSFSGLLYISSLGLDVTKLVIQSGEGRLQDSQIKGFMRFLRHSVGTISSSLLTMGMSFGSFNLWMQHYVKPGNSLLDKNLLTEQRVSAEVTKIIDKLILDVSHKNYRDFCSVDGLYQLMHKHPHRFKSGTEIEALYGDLHKDIIEIIKYIPWWVIKLKLKKYREKFPFLQYPGVPTFYKWDEKRGWSPENSVSNNTKSSGSKPGLPDKKAQSSIPRRK